MADKGRKKFLIVDDSSTMRMLITMTIKKSLPDIVVLEAVNGKDAVEKLKSDDIDLIITDLNMPEMNGAELVQWIRESFSKDLPIIIVTTEGEEKKIEGGETLGVTAYMTKPIKGSELKETVQGLFS